MDKSLARVYPEILFFVIDLNSEAVMPARTKIAAQLPLIKKPAYPGIGRETFLAQFRPLVTQKEFNRIATAYQFMKYGHRGQTRDGGKVRYAEHPKAVALILFDELEIADWHAIVLALLHDIQEDSHLLNWENIEHNFGKRVAMGLKLLTKSPRNGYLNRLRLYATAETLVVKLCDRLHNLRTLDACRKEKKRSQIRETRAHYLPLADLLIRKLPASRSWRGIYLKRQIELLCAHHEIALSGNT